MSMFKRQLLILLIIYIRETSSVIDAPYDAAEKVWKLYSMLDESNLASLASPNTVKDLFGNDPEVNQKIIDQMSEIHAILHEIENSVNSKMKNNLLKIMEPSVFAHKCVDSLGLFISKIAEDYNTFYETIIRDGYIQDRLLNNLTISIFPDIDSNIEMIRKIITYPNELLPGSPSLIAGINRYAKTQYKEKCNNYQSIDEILVHVFKIAIVAEIKTTLMLPLANLHQSRNNEGIIICKKNCHSLLRNISEIKPEWKDVNRDAMTKFRSFFRSYGVLMQQNLNLAEDLYMRACDPINGTWILNKNYYEFTETTQTMIFRYQPTGCERESCQNMMEQGKTRCDARYYDERSGCSGTYTNCEDYGAVIACVLKHGPKKLQYVNSAKSGFIGNNSNCPEDDGYTIDNRKGPHSGYATCGCQCHESNDKISLLTMVSRVDHDEVIIGLRLKHKNNILHIQPRVGKLMANGYIQRYSERWLNIPNNIDASQIQSANENSIFFFDNILLPPKFVLTGVKFEIARRGAVTGFAIAIIGSPFNYRSGQLNHERVVQLSLRTHPGRSLTFAPVSSIPSESSNEPISTDAGYIQLKRSLEKNNSGHSMLPLFDAIPVTTDPPSALSGFGIFHKGREGYAGFISLRIYGISYKQYFGNFTIVD